MAGCLKHSCENGRFLPVCVTPPSPPDNALYWILRDDINAWCVEEGETKRKEIKQAVMQSGKEVRACPLLGIVKSKVS